MDRILVTGGLGFIGSHTVDMLIKAAMRLPFLTTLRDRSIRERCLNIRIMTPNT